MNDLINNMYNDEYNNDYSNRLISAKKIFDNIYKVCGYEQRFGCGSYLITGTEYKYNFSTYKKQKLLFEKAKRSNNVLEIGTYMGHSLLIMLLANPNLKITTIDMVEKYSKAATDYLQNEFPNAKINFIKGNSLNILPKLDDQFDLFHIDGSHSRSIIKKEFEKCIFLSKGDNINIVFDDYETCRTLNNTIEKSFNILDSQIPKCNFTNRFMSIFFNNIDELELQLKNFQKLYLIEYLKELPKRAFNFWAIYNKVKVALRHLPER